MVTQFKRARNCILITSGERPRDTWWPAAHHGTWSKHFTILVVKHPTTTPCPPPRHRWKPVLMVSKPHTGWQRQPICGILPERVCNTNGRDQGYLEKMTHGKNKITQVIKVAKSLPAILKKIWDAMVSIKLVQNEKKPLENKEISEVWLSNLKHMIKGTKNKRQKKCDKSSK